MAEISIRCNFASWRKNIIKEHNAYRKTIQTMGRLYDELFPAKEVYRRKTREELIRESFQDKEAIECLKKTILSY